MRYDPEHLSAGGLGKVHGAQLLGVAFGRIERVHEGSVSEGLSCVAPIFGVLGAHHTLASHALRGTEVALGATIKQQPFWSRIYNSP